MSNVVKIPCSLEVFKFRKTDQYWSIGFSITPEFIEAAKPLMERMNKAFILACIQVDDIAEANTVLQAENIIADAPVPNR